MFNCPDPRGVHTFTLSKEMCASLTKTSVKQSMMPNKSTEDSSHRKSMSCPLISLNQCMFQSRLKSWKRRLESSPIALDWIDRQFCICYLEQTRWRQQPETSAPLSFFLSNVSYPSTEPWQECVTTLIIPLGEHQELLWSVFCLLIILMVSHFSIILWISFFS